MYKPQIWLKAGFLCKVSEEICEVDSLLYQGNTGQWWYIKCICYSQWMKQGSMLTPVLFNLLFACICHMLPRVWNFHPVYIRCQLDGFLFDFCSWILSRNLFWLLCPPAAQRQQYTVDAKEIPDAAILFSLTAWRLKQQSSSGGGGRAGREGMVLGHASSGCACSCTCVNGGHNSICTACISEKAHTSVITCHLCSQGWGPLD